MRSWLPILVVLLPALAGAAQRARSFQVGATVVRSARVRAEVTPAGSSAMRLAGSRTVLVRIDAAPAVLVSGTELPLPPGTAQVTVNY